ncbi:MAG: glycosyltransferase [Salinivenus sp.]
MPASVLALLALVVGCYSLLIGVAAVRFYRVRRTSSSQEKTPRPAVSVVVPVDSAESGLDSLLATLQDAAYPSDRYELVLVSTDKAVESLLPTRRPPGPDAPGLQVVHVDERPGALLQSAAVRGAASGDILLALPSDATVSPDWLPTMVRHAQREEGRVKGPVTYEHEDLFFPRLQALEQVGRTAAAVGAWNEGLPLPSPHPNLGSTLPSAKSDATAPHDASTSESLRGTLAPETLVYAPPPATTLGEYVEITAQRFLKALRGPSKSVTISEGVYWFTHTVLLVTGAVAVAVPSWRQPVLLAFLAKMGADLLLAVPATRQFGQRGLLRSLVPTELFLVLAVPAGGVLTGWIALRNHFRSD